MINTLSGATSELAPSAGAAGRRGVPSRDQFLQLLVAQMTNQDPLKPMESSEMMAQVASLESLERMGEMRDALVQSRRAQNLSASLLIGQQVEVLSAQGVLRGTVDSVRLQGGEALLMINGGQYPLDSVVSIQGQNKEENL